MKRLIAVLLLLGLGLLTMLPDANAGGCGYVSSYRYSYPTVYPTYSTPVYYNTVNVTAFLPFVAYTPIAVTSYLPTAAAPVAPLNAVVADPCAKAMAKYEARLEALELENRKLRTMPAPAPVQPLAQPQAPQQPQPRAAAPLSGLSVLVAKCAKCHASGIDVATFGGGRVLIDGGQLVSVDSVLYGKLYKRLLSDNPKVRMPPESEPPLSPDEGSALIDYLGRIRVAVGGK